MCYMFVKSKQVYIASYNRYIGSSLKQTSGLRENALTMDSGSLPVNPGRHLEGVIYTTKTSGWEERRASCKVGQQYSGL